MPKPGYEEGYVTVLWNQAVQTDREVTANRPDILLLRRVIPVVLAPPQKKPFCMYVIKYLDYQTVVILT